MYSLSTVESSWPRSLVEGVAHHSAWTVLAPTAVWSATSASATAQHLVSPSARSEDSHIEIGARCSTRSAVTIADLPT